MDTNLLAFINVHGQEWQAIKRYLTELRGQEVQKLVKDTSHDDSNKRRGAIETIDRLLGVERDAEIASQQRT
jgi:hypothetical protein